MEIETKYYGLVTYDQSDIMMFENGIPGFEDEREFIIFPLKDTDLLVLQSSSHGEVSFLMTDPFIYFPNYEFVLSEDVKKGLAIESEKDVAVFTILTFKDKVEETTANLQAPIILNQAKKKGKQVILNDKKYTTKHKLFQPSPVKQGGR